MAALDNIAALEHFIQDAMKGEMSQKELQKFKQLLERFSECDDRPLEEIRRIQSRK